MSGTDGTTGAGEDGVSVYWVAAVLLRSRRLLMIFTVVGILAGVGVTLVRHATYTTTFTFLPQQSDDLSKAAGLAGLAGQLGISLGSLGGGGGPEQSPQFYADLLKTKRLLAPIAVGSVATGADSTAREPLATFLDLEAPDSARLTDKTIRELRNEVISASVAVRTTGVVTVNVRTRSPYVSLAIARQLLSGLGEYNLVTRQSQARQERVFTESRLNDARAALRVAEDELQRFLVNNRQTDFPALTFQRERLQREVDLRQQIVTSLAQKYEENRIREVRDTPVLTLIELPDLASRADPRLRVLILLIGIAGGLTLGVLVALLRALWNREGVAAGDPARAMLRDEWARMRGVARS